MLTNEQLDEKINNCKDVCSICNKKLLTVYVEEIDRCIGICIYQLAKAMNMVDAIKNEII